MAKTTVLCWKTTLVTKSGHITVEDYERWRDEGDQAKSNLAIFVRERLRERYIDPVNGMPADQKNGFATMALSCLLIETLESFYRGQAKSPNSGLAFCGFFDRHVGLLPEFKGHAQGFYENVRCGILHQGETMQRWSLTRKSAAPLFDQASLTINATKFNRMMGTAIDRYANSLETADRSEDLWMRFIKKMNATVKHCG